MQTVAASAQTIGNITRYTGWIDVNIYTTNGAGNTTSREEIIDPTGLKMALSRRWGREHDVNRMGSIKRRWIGSYTILRKYYLYI